MNNSLYSFNTHHYVDEYLQNNINKDIEIHVSFSDSIEWRDKIFKGKLDTVGKDFIVIKNSNSKTIIWSIYIDYAIIL